jgi:HemK-related putative methylase
MEIYSPREDSYLLSETLKDYLKDKDKGISIMDMGSGSGIQAQTCKDMGFENILTADINPDAVKLLKEKGFDSINTDLFSKIEKSSKFDLIIFNAPYLPEHKYDKEKDTTGGKKGYETIVEFLRQAKWHLNKKGTIMLLFSSFSKPRIIKTEAKKLGYKHELMASKRIEFEELLVYMLKSSD